MTEKMRPRWTVLDGGKGKQKKLTPYTIACLLLLLVSSEAPAATYTAQQMADMAPMSAPACANGVCTTPFRIVWTTSTNPVYYSSTPKEALDFSVALYYGSTEGFCQWLGGKYVGLDPAPGSAWSMNGEIYASYHANCGATRYGNPDLRGYTPPVGFCPQGYQSIAFGAPGGHCSSPLPARNCPTDSSSTAGSSTMCTCRAGLVANIDQTACVKLSNSKGNGSSSCQSNQVYRGNPINIGSGVKSQ